MRIIFIGCVELSANLLKTLISKKVNIVGICTKKISNFNSDHFDLSLIAKSSSIPFIYTIDINSDETINWIKNLNPDIIFCFGWSSLLKKDLLRIPPMGTLGFHPSELPFNRGRHPLIWALALGLEKTASTFFFMNEGADTGDILSQRKLKIESFDNANTLYKKVIEIAKSQIKEFLPSLINKSFTVTKQNHNNSNSWRKRGVMDGQIDWRMSSESIYNLIRALTKPYVGAHFIYQNKKVKVWEAKIVNNHNKNIEPGKVLSLVDGGFIIKVGDNSIRIIKMDPLINIKVGEYL